ncbi:MAG: phosphatidylserine/phosphatidylglycerophosphate/cardiolipin synthase family protein [Haliangium ochraceum]
MTAVRCSTATRVQLLTDREEEWDLRMEMVRGARRFLLLTTYYFGGDERSGQMADALAAAARRGVRLVLVIDRFGQRLSQNLSTASERPRLEQRLRDIEAAGGLVVRYAPAALRHRLVGGGVHVKVQVSEAGVAIFGSSNVAHHSFAQWNETSLRIEGPTVDHLVEDGCHFAGLSAGETAALVGLLPRTPAAESGQSLRYVREDPSLRSGPFFPFGIVRNRLTDELVRVIDGAQRLLCIASLYCKPAPVLKDAIVRACRRGVDVEIFHSHRDSLGVTQVPWISASIQYGSLLREGARIYENRSGEHSKVIFADDCQVAVGSYNLEHAAHDRLIEAMIFSADPALCGHFRSLFQALRRSPGNVALRPGWLSELPLQLQVKRWLCRPLQRWM